MLKELKKRGRYQITENLRYQVKDRDGNVKPIFQDNAIFRFLMKKEIVSPHFPKIPLLLGRWSDERVVSNLVTDAGKAGVASRINGAGGEAVFEYIALGTGTTAAAAGDTSLVVETHRELATSSRVTTDVTDDTAELVNTFNFTASHAITESGVLNASTTGTLLARQVFSAINVADGDSLQVTWDFDVD